MNALVGSAENVGTEGLSASRYRIPRSPLAAFLLLPLFYVISGKLSVHLTVMPEGMAILWLPNSALLAAFLIFRGRHFVPFCLLAVAGEMAVSLPDFRWQEALLFAATNVGEAALAFALLHRSGFNPCLPSLGNGLKFLLLGPLVSALAAAFSGAAIYSVFRGNTTSYLEFVRIWWFGDGLGLMICTPLYLAFWFQPVQPPRSVVMVHRADALVALVALFTVGLLIASKEGSLLGMHFGPILLVPLVAYAAARFDLRGTSLVVAAAALLIAVLLTAGHQVFGVLPPREAVIQAQETIFIMSLVAFGLYALLAELRDKRRELDNLNRDLEALVAMRTDELNQLNTRLAHLALTDPLTGLFNRRAFFDSAQRELEASRRHDRKLVLMIIDIDHFKAINDRFGHHTGDQVLQKTVECIQRMIRAGDTLARYGGEEFVLLAPETGAKGAVELATRMLGALRAERILVEGSHEIRVTASIGLAVVDSREADLEAALKRADDALYAAKAGGRDRVVAAGLDG